MTGTESPDEQALALLGDDLARAILAATDERPLSAEGLEERCDASLATIYRRVESLLDHGLLVERTDLRSDGNHRREFESNFDRLDVSLNGSEFDVEIARRDDAPDRFRGIWDAMQGGWDG